MASFYHESGLKIEALAECEGAHAITRSLALKPAYKELGRTICAWAITPKDAYTH